MLTGVLILLPCSLLFGLSRFFGFYSLILSGHPKLITLLPRVEITRRFNGTGEIC